MQKITFLKWSEGVFLITKGKNTVSWTYIISYVKGEETVETFHEKELLKTNQKGFRIQQVIKRKGDNAESN